MQVRAVTYADILRPCDRSRALLYDIVLVVGGSLLMGLCARIAIWLPFSPVPVTAQTFAVLMIGVLFGARRGGLCMLVYIAEGAAGLGVFSMGRGGIAMLSGPTGGYLAGFVVAAYVAGLLAESGWDRRVGTTVLAMVLGNVVIYTFGLFWLSCLIGFGKALVVGLYPFIVGDILKIFLAAGVLPAGWKLLGLVGLPARKDERQ